MQYLSSNGLLKLTFTIFILVALGFISNSSIAWQRYDQGCNSCHGGFFSGVSPKGTTIPFNNKHEMHINANYMDAACNLCHGGQGVSYLASSGGTNTNPGIGCIGCHGRSYDGIGYSAAGLRRHHFNTGTTSCAGCHSNDPEPLPENIKPTYYGTVDTNIDDPCNLEPDFLENWSIGDTLGLDNDGDGLYDGEDGDCIICPADLTGDDVVNIDDIFAVLGLWGNCPDPCPPYCDGDLTEDCMVNIDDIFAILGQWGPCE